jgi:hypothetical protein
VRSLAELRRRRQSLSRVWEQVLAEGSPGPSGLNPGLLASWRRSSAWVSPEVRAAPVDDSDRAIDEWRTTAVSAGLCKTEADVRRTADEGDLIAAVTDRTGRIVWTHGSPVMRRKAEQVNFVPGGHWDEASVGTNALALALRTGQPSTVYSAEHFSRAVHGWVCYSVPLTDHRSGDVLGVLDLSTTWDRAHPLAMGTAQLLARMVTEAMPDTWASPAADVELRVLGDWQVLLGGRPLMLPRRQIEILLLLALQPAGLSLEALHDRLYGEARVSTATLKAEVSRLRTALNGQVGSRPYRLLAAVDSDLQRALRALDRGEVATAVAAARGPLLPGSESPAVSEWREYLAVALRSAVLRSVDADTVRMHADRDPYDAELQQHLVDVLPVGDPRAAAALARVHRAGPE